MQRCDTLKAEAPDAGVAVVEKQIDMQTEPLDPCQNSSNILMCICRICFFHVFSTTPLFAPPTPPQECKHPQYEVKKGKKIITILCVGTTLFSGGYYNTQAAARRCEATTEMSDGAP